MSSWSRLVILLFLLGNLTSAFDHYLLSCSAPSSVALTPSTYDGRIWHSDNNSTFSPDFSSTTNYSTMDDSQTPFSTARIFATNFTYSFPVSPGPKFIRLFFNTYFADSCLTVESSTGHLLLHNFNAYSSDWSDIYIFKEFYVHVDSSILRLTFSPTPPCTYAFINGIEIVSIPDTLYAGPTSPRSVGTHLELTKSTAMETAYRLNVGGGRNLSSQEDSGSMYRQWVNDAPYLGDFTGLTGFSEFKDTSINYTAATPNYTAPVPVYNSFRSIDPWFSSVDANRVNLTWGFELDSGFLYLVRLHWCEVMLNMRPNFRVFDVYLNQLKADEAVDIFAWVGAHTPAHKDYIVDIDNGFLQVVMRPNTASNPMYIDVLLNGLEIFKLSRSDGSLAVASEGLWISSSPALSPEGLWISSSPALSPEQQPALPKSRYHYHHTIPVILVAVAGVILVVLLPLSYFLTTRGIIKFRTRIRRGSPSSNSKHSCSAIMLSEIKSATGDFSEAFIIGIGGFGIVYVGTLDGQHGPIKAAIKRLKPSSKQGIVEFRTEIEMLSNLRHEHLVSLIGYCDEQDEMILVYEYLQSGTLRDHLYNTSNPPLSWNQRLQVCIGAAKGLHYLHEGAEHKIIHRDIKSSNILLDDMLVAKVSDFGLSKFGPMSEGDYHISTRVKGSFGYVDPEYYRRRQLTEKSDVYSFGVVLFEVLCGRPAVNLSLPKEQMNLAVWARSQQKRGSLEGIVDPNLKGQIEPECLRMFGEIAERCVRNNGIDRPSAAEVLQALLDICLKEAKNEGENLSLP